MDDPQEAGVYAQADFREVNERFVTDLLATFGPTHELFALDLGCGPADITLRLRIERPRWRILGMDASWPMLELARSDPRCQENGIFLVRAAAQGAPLRSSCMRLVFSNSLIHHLRDPLPVWREIVRLLAGGGFIFVRDLMRPDSQETARRIVEEIAGREPALLREEFSRSLLAAFTPQEMREQLAQAGLARLSVRTVNDRHMDVFGQV